MRRGHSGFFDRSDRPATIIVIWRLLFLCLRVRPTTGSARRKRVLGAQDLRLEPTDEPPGGGTSSTTGTCSIILILTLTGTTCM